MSSKESIVNPVAPWVSSQLTLLASIVTSTQFLPTVTLPDNLTGHENDEMITEGEINVFLITEQNSKLLSQAVP